MRIAAVERYPVHIRALAMYMTFSLIMHLGTLSGLSLALPVMIKEFDVSVITGAWIGIGYSVGLAGATLAMGAVSTYFDRRLLVVIGVALDVVVLTITFFTGSIYVVIICRFLSAAVRIFPWLILQVIGVGGFAPEKRGKAVGIATVQQGIGMLVSLPLAGFVIDHWGWRWLFLGSAGAYALFIPLVLLVLPKLPPDTAKKQSLSEFDFAGSALMVSGVVCVLTALQLFARGFNTGAMTMVLGVAGLSILAAFIWVELHTKSPILRLSLFKVPGVSLASSQAIVMGIVSGSLTLMLPFLFINGYGWTAAATASVLFVQNIFRPVSGLVSGRLADRFGSAHVIFPSAIVSGIGQVLLAFLGVSPAVQVIVVALLFWGTSQALMTTANLRQIYAALPKSQLHLAPSLNLVVSTLGGTSGQAIGAMAVEQAKATGTGAGADLVGVLGSAMIVITAFFFIGMVVTQLLPRIFLRSQVGETQIG